MNACTTSSGDNATMAASQRRRPATMYVPQVTTSMHRLSRSAVTLKYVSTSGGFGISGTESATAPYSRASHAETPMNAPVRTGYSTG